MQQVRLQAEAPDSVEAASLDRESTQQRGVLHLRENGANPQPVFCRVLKVTVENVGKVQRTFGATEEGKVFRSQVADITVWSLFLLHH